jgi:hypothetical protein
MASQLRQRIDALAAHGDSRLLAQLTRGIERRACAFCLAATCRKRRTRWRSVLR